MRPLPPKPTKAKAKPLQPRREADEENKRVGSGRPRVYGTELPVYDSMDQCASATGIPVDYLKRAKRSGCLFIRHGRVHLAEFIRWFFSQADGNDGEDWARRSKRALAIKAEIELEKLQNQVIEWQTVDSFITRLVSIDFFGELDRLGGEFPARLKGKSEVEIAEECDKEKKAIKESLRGKMETWKKQKGKV